MSKPSEEVQRSLDDFESQFGFKLAHLESYPKKLPREDVSTHIFLPSNLTGLESSPPHISDIRSWFSERSVLIFEEPHFYPGAPPVYRIAPMVRVEVSVAYHTTRRDCWESISVHGLLPGSVKEGRFNDSNRLDCEGNIYLCEKLGCPEDAGVPCSFSAFWWKDHLSNKYNHNADEWLILRIDMQDLKLICYRDMYQPVS